MKKRILIVIPDCNTGGTVTSLNSLLNSKFTQKYDVRVFVMNEFGIEQFPTICKYSIGTQRIISLLYALMKYNSLWVRLQLLPIKILKRLPFLGKKICNSIERHIIDSIENRYDFDHVISYAESASLRFVTKFKCPQKTTWIHCDYCKGRPAYLNESDIYKQYTNIVCVSNYTKNSFCSRYPELADKVHCVYNIVDYNYIIEKSKYAVNDSRFNNTGFTIISVGRFAPVKRFTCIPLIARKLKDLGLTFRWYIIGGGQGAKKETSEIQKQIELQDTGDCVILLGRKDNPYPYFKAADLLVSTSESEACPMIFNEAKILNLPIISTNFGSSFEFIKEGYDGYISSIEEIHKAIASIMTDKKKYDSLSPGIMDDLREESIINTLNSII